MAQSKSCISKMRDIFLRVPRSAMLWFFGCILFWNHFFECFYCWKIKKNQGVIRWKTSVSFLDQVLMTWGFRLYGAAAQLMSSRMSALCFIGWALVWHEGILTPSWPTMHRSRRGSPCPVLVVYLPALNVLTFLNMFLPVTLSSLCCLCIYMSCNALSCHHVLCLVLLPSIYALLKAWSHSELQLVRLISLDDSQFFYYLISCTLLFLKLNL